jgi:HEAT repeat protein
MTPLREYPDQRAGQACFVRIIAQLLLLTGFLGISHPAVVRGQSPEPDISSILSEMALRQHQFNPQRLHAMGTPGLSALLDELFPETASPKPLRVPTATVDLLIEKLGGDSSLARQQAMNDLTQLGPAAEPWVIAAAGSPDAEVAWRARSVLRAWQQRIHDDKSMYLAAFSIYGSGIRDGQRLSELVRRTAMALESGELDDGRHSILEACIAILVASGHDLYTDPLKPLLKHRDPRVAVLVTQAAGVAAASLSEGRYYPGLLLEALRSDQPEVVSAAIDWTEFCNDAARAAEAQRLLIAIFEGSDEPLKFQASSSLMHRYDNSAARDFLLQQAMSSDMNRRSLALSSLCNRRRPGTAPDDKTLEVLGKLLKSSDSHLRYLTANALASYTGEKVVKLLVDALADSNNLTPSAVGDRLLDQPDTAMLRRELADAAKNHVNEKVRKRAAVILQELEQRE